MENIACGLYSPLTGPLSQSDYLAVLENGRLSNETPWTIPIILDACEEKASEFSEDDRVSIVSSGKTFAVMDIDDKYSWKAKTN